MVFYFLSYATRKAGTSHWQFQEALLRDEHPVAARIRWRQKENERLALLQEGFPPPAQQPSYTEYRIISWQEISEAEYQQFEGEIG